MMVMTDKVVVIKELSVSGEGLLIGGGSSNIGDGTGYGIRDLPIGPLQSRTSED
jgi:hypothetical protein